MKLKHIIIATILIFVLGLVVINLNSGEEEISLEVGQNNEEIIGGIVDEEGKEESDEVADGDLGEAKDEESEDNEKNTNSGSSSVIWESVTPKTNVALPFDVLSLEEGTLKIRVFDSTDLNVITGVVSGVINDIKTLNRGTSLNREVTILVDGREIIYDYQAQKIRRQ